MVSAPVAKPNPKHVWLSIAPGPAVYFQGQVGPNFQLRGAFELPKIVDRLSFVATLPLNLISLRFGIPELSTTLSTWVFAVVPTVGIRVHLTDRLRLSLDVGVGFAYYRTTFPQAFVGYITMANTVPELGASIGADFQLTDRLSVFLEPITIHAHTSAAVPGAGGFANASSSGYWSCLAGLSFRIPQPGEAR